VCPPFPRRPVALCPRPPPSQAACNRAGAGGGPRASRPFDAAQEAGPGFSQDKERESRPGRAARLRRGPRPVPPSLAGLGRCLARGGRGRACRVVSRGGARAGVVVGAGVAVAGVLRVLVALGSGAVGRRRAVVGPAGPVAVAVRGVLCGPGGVCGCAVGVRRAWWRVSCVVAGRVVAVGRAGGVFCGGGVSGGAVVSSAGLAASVAALRPAAPVPAVRPVPRCRRCGGRRTGAGGCRPPRAPRRKGKEHHSGDTTPAACEDFRAHRQSRPKPASGHGLARGRYVPSAALASSVGRRNGSRPRLRPRGSARQSDPGRRRTGAVPRLVGQVANRTTW